MSAILYFFLGVAFMVIVMPVCDALANVVITFCELLKGYMSVSISKCNKKIDDLKNPPSKKVQAFSNEE